MRAAARSLWLTTFILPSALTIQSLVVFFSMPRRVSWLSQSACRGPSGSAYCCVSAQKLGYPPSSGPS